jgi:hypothetical protein
VYAEFIDAIAYWLWQFGSAISPVLQNIRSQHQSLRIIVELRWAAGDEPGEASEVTQAHSRC